MNFLQIIGHTVYGELVCAANHFLTAVDQDFCILPFNPLSTTLAEPKNGKEVTADIFHIQMIPLPQLL